MLRLGWFATGRGDASRQLLATVQDKIEKGLLDAEISFVFSNREPGEGEKSDLLFDLVARHGIPLVCFSSRKFRGSSSSFDRTGFDREVIRRLEGFAPQFCILAGYMLIVGEEMCRRYDMVNLHPAPPGGPAGTWQEVIWQLIEARAARAGAMMHLVTPQLDQGPPVTYFAFPLRGEPFDSCWRAIEGIPAAELRWRSEAVPLFQAIRQHELAREFPLIISTIEAFAGGKVRIERKQVVDARGRVIPAYDLSAEIERELSSRKP